MLRPRRRSLTITNITLLFTGMVLALQTAYSLAAYGGKPFVGDIIALSIVRELGPVLTALMIAGRVGAGITAELGSMAVTEQVDALRVAGREPGQEARGPARRARWCSCCPLLTILADMVGIFGGLLMALLRDRPDRARSSSTHVLDALQLNDIVSGVGKTVFFGFFIGIIACYNGLTATGRRGRRGAGHDRDRGDGVDRGDRLGFLPHEALPALLDRGRCRSSASRTSTSRFGEQRRAAWASTSTSAAGETLVVLGGCGSGKSVLLRHAIGLHSRRTGARSGWTAPTSADSTRTSCSTRARRSGCCSRAGALFDSMTVVRERGLRAARAHRLGRGARSRARVREVLGLRGARRTWRPHALRPLGRDAQARGAGARHRRWHPRAILYDEPTTGLDPITANTINHLIRNLQQRLGVTSIVVTHDIHSAFTVGDRIAFLHEGRIHFDGTVAEAKAADGAAAAQLPPGRRLCRRPRGRDVMVGTFATLAFLVLAVAVMTVGRRVAPARAGPTFRVDVPAHRRAAHRARR